MVATSPPFSISVTNGSTEGRVLATHFGPGVSLVFQGYYSYTPSTLPPPNTGTPFSSTQYGCGDKWALSGTDAATGFTFGPMAPSLFGGKGSDPTAGVFHQIAGTNSRTQAGVAFATPSQVHQLSLQSGLLGPAGTGISTALKYQTQSAYYQPDQSPYQLFLDTSRDGNGDLVHPQGMYYLRYWFKLLPGFTQAWGTGWRWFGLTENKSVADNNRGQVMLELQGGQPRVWFRYDSMKGGTLGGVSKAAWSTWDQQWGPSLQEDVWYKLEFSTRPSNTATGAFAWAALDGQQFAFSTSQNIFDGEPPGWWGLFLTMFYGNHASALPGMLVTGLELWDRWPADASAHPSV